MKKAKRSTKADEDAVLLKTLARAHGEAAFAELAGLASGAQSESVKLAAIKELLDRGFGRAPQAQGENTAGSTTHVMVDDGYGH